jgi:hypothetical protein
MSEGDGRTEVTPLDLVHFAGEPVMQVCKSCSLRRVVQSVAASSILAGARALTATDAAGARNAPARDGIRLINQEAGWNTVPMVAAKVGMPFDVHNQPGTGPAEFARWAAMPGAQVVSADFNGHGLGHGAPQRRRVHVQDRRAKRGC